MADSEPVTLEGSDERELFPLGIWHRNWRTATPLSCRSSIISASIFPTWTGWHRPGAEERFSVACGPAPEHGRDRENCA